MILRRRAGKHGTYNPKHNDRNFDLTNSEHIDPERAKGNIYWDCFHGFRSALAPQDPDDLAGTFSDVERQFYETHYSEFIERQNERNAKIRHTERNRSIPDLLSSTSIHEVHTLLKTAFSYAVEWDLIHKIPLPREAPKANREERTIWDEKTMLAALQTIENPALHLAVHLSMILSLRKGEILGLQPSDLDFGAADGRGTISVSKTMQRANKDALEKLDPKQVYYTFPDRHEGSKSSLITQDLTPAAPQQPPESKQLETTKITGKAILEAIRLMDAEN